MLYVQLDVPPPMFRSTFIVFASMVIVIAPDMLRIPAVFVPVGLPVAPVIGAGFFSASGVHLPLKSLPCAARPVAKTTAASTLNVIAKRRIWKSLLASVPAHLPETRFIIDQFGAQRSPPPPLPSLLQKNGRPGVN